MTSMSQATKPVPAPPGDRPKPKKKDRRQMVLETFEPDRLDIAAPLRSYAFDLGQDQRAFVFVLSSEDRARMSLMQVERAAQQVGDLIYPHQAMFLVVQPGARMTVYEIRQPPEGAGKQGRARVRIPPVVVDPERAPPPEAEDPAAGEG